MMVMVVVCNNKECTEFEIEKHVRMQHIGNGIFLDGKMICGRCHCEVEQKEMGRRKEGAPS